MILPVQKHALALYRIALAIRCTRGAYRAKLDFNGAGVQKENLADAKLEAHVPCTSC